MVNGGDIVIDVIIRQISKSNCIKYLIFDLLVYNDKLLKIFYSYKWLFKYNIIIIHFQIISI